MRKIVDYIVSDSESRDFNKHYVITEMPAYQAEKWCYKAINGMIKSGIYVPEEINVLELPAQVLAFFGVTHFLKIDFEHLNPLLDEMMACVKIRANKDNPLLDRAINNEMNDVEEVSTLINLRLEVFKLHMGFLKAVVAPLLSKYLTNQTNQNVQ